MYAKDFYDKFKEEFLYLKDENEILPEPLICDKPNTLEHDTIVRRIPEVILGSVLKAEETFFPTSTRKTQLKKLESLFKNGEKETYEKLNFPIEEEDKKYWDFFEEYFVKKHLPIVKCPWLVSELYFYRYLNLLYISQKNQIDPYAETKTVALVKNKNTIEEMCACANVLFDMAKENSKPDKQIFSIFFMISLWSNVFDLSWKVKQHHEARKFLISTEEKNGNEEKIVEEKEKEKHEEKKEDEKEEEEEEEEEEKKEKTKENLNEEVVNDIKKTCLKDKSFYFQTEDLDKLYNSLYVDNIVCNDIDEIFEMISKKQKHSRFDMVLDNAGIEIVADLCLLIFLSLYFEKIVIHVKKLPQFVSDVREVDFNETVEYLIHVKQPNCHRIGCMCRHFVKTERWIVKENVFWNLPLPYWVLTKELYEDFCKSDFICFKGDANCRRCMGDLKFDFCTSHKTIFSYFPSPVVILRCLKSPIGCGIDKKIVDELKRKDPSWSNCGKYATMQYCPGKK